MPLSLYVFSPDSLESWHLTLPFFLLLSLFSDTSVHRCFYAQKILREDAFTNKSLHKCLCGKKQFFCFFSTVFSATQGLKVCLGDIGTSYINTFVHRIPLFSHQKTSTRKLLGTETFTHGKLLHTNASTDKDIYTHTKALTHRLFLYTETFTRKTWHTKVSTHTHRRLHTEYFTRKCFFTHRPLRTNIVRNVCAFGATTPLRSAGHAAAPVRQIWTITTSMCWELGGAVEVANGYHHGYKSR